MLDLHALVASLRSASAGLDCDADHLYRWGDRRVWIPSVTQLLERVGYYDSSHYADGAAERGSEGHRLIAEGVPVELWPAELQGYGSAWERWTDEVGWVTAAHELSLRGPAAYRDGKPLRGGAPLWCGTDDLVGVARRLGGAWTIDIKLGLPADWHCIQLAGYLSAMIAVDCAAAGLRTANLYLRPDGSYDFVAHPDPAGDIGEWWSVIRRVRRKRGRMYWTPWRSLLSASVDDPFGESPPPVEPSDWDRRVAEAGGDVFAALY